MRKQAPDTDDWTRSPQTITHHILHHSSLVLTKLIPTLPTSFQEMARSTSTSTSKSTPTSTAKGRRAPPLTRGDRKRTRTQRPSLSPSPSLSDSSALSSIPSGHGPEPTSKPLPLPKSADERQPEPEPQSSTHLSPPSIPHARIAALDAVRVPLDAGDVLYIPDVRYLAWRACEPSPARR